MLSHRKSHTCHLTTFQLQWDSSFITELAKPAHLCVEWHFFKLRKVSWHKQTFLCTQSRSAALSQPSVWKLSASCLIPHYLAILTLLFRLRVFSEDSRPAAAKNSLYWHAACNTIFRYQADLTYHVKFYSNGTLSGHFSYGPWGCDGSHFYLQVHQWKW